jgi:hypothetical protein
MTQLVPAFGSTTNGDEEHRIAGADEMGRIMRQRPSASRIVRGTHWDGREVSEFYESLRG